MQLLCLSQSNCQWQYENTRRELHQQELLSTTVCVSGLHMGMTSSISSSSSTMSAPMMCLRMYTTDERGHAQYNLSAQLRVRSEHRALSKGELMQSRHVCAHAFRRS